MINHFRGAWMYLKEAGPRVLVLSLIFGLIIQGIGYFAIQSRQAESDRKLAEEIRVAIREINTKADQIAFTSDANSEKLRQGVEILVCLYAAHVPQEEIRRQFPGADLSRCQQLLSGINNTDGSFLSREADGQGTPAQPAPQPTERNPQSNNVNEGDNDPGLVGGILNTAGGIADRILP